MVRVVLVSHLDSIESHLPDLIQLVENSTVQPSVDKQKEKGGYRILDYFFNLNYLL